MGIIAARNRTISDYYMAATADEALAYLTAHHGRAQVIAGGTLLMPQMQRGEAAATHLVDVSGVGSMRCVCADDRLLAVGGATTLRTLASHERIRDEAPLLYEAAQVVATPRVRALATLGGNIASAGGSAETLVALVALGAEAEIRNMTGAQWLPIESLSLRSGVSRIDSMSEILTRVRFARQSSSQGAAMARIDGLAAHERSALALALVLGLSPSGDLVTYCAVALGSQRGLPHRVAAVEQALTSQPLPVASAREAFVVLLNTWARDQRLVAPDQVEVVEQIVPLAGGSFDHALAMARRRLAANGRA